MKVLNRILLATLTVCAIAFTHGASAEDKVKSDVVKIKKPVKITITNPVEIKTAPINDKMKDAPSATSGPKDEVRKY